MNPVPAGPVSTNPEPLRPATSPGPAPRPRRFLVCAPRFFDVQYAINPWMSEDVRVDAELAGRQWEALIRAYRAHGHTVESVAPAAGLPDMVFAANSALVVEGRVFGSNFHAPQRRPESTEYDTWFKAAGYEVYRPESLCEGEGDLVPVGPYILAGTGFRTTRAAHDEVQEFFGMPTIGLQLIDPYFYHLDTALFVLSDGSGAGDGTGAGEGEGEGDGIAAGHESGNGPLTARIPTSARLPATPTGPIRAHSSHSPTLSPAPTSPPANIAYYPEAFSSGSREVLRRLFPEAVIATRQDAMAFGLNSVSDGRHVFVAPRATGLIDQLGRRGYVPVPVDLSEFHKAGGGIKCCTQEIRS